MVTDSPALAAAVLPRVVIEDEGMVRPVLRDDVPTAQQRS
jgi:hypothetical protein